MRATAILPLLILAACASTTTPEKLKGMSTAEVCYTGMVEPEHRQLVDAELTARKADCRDHAAEIEKIQDMERRAGGATPGDAAAPKPAGGGMGRY
ncbi:MAG TPA: hypothetical protein VEQ87_01330 [Burkholderiales bacterium]|nr:hypothetical protein [Burkholderiales bacterium]